MKTFFKKQKRIILTLFFATGFLMSLFALTAHLPVISADDDLAQILAVETSLLKQWQQSSGIKKNIDYGAENNEVILLQKMLAQDPVIYPEKTVSGYYGDLTKSAVTRFQGEYSLPLSGLVDTGTREKLNNIFLENLCPKPDVIYPDLSLKKIGKNFSVPTDYTPESIRSISSDFTAGGIVCLRSDVAQKLEQMFVDARVDGVKLMMTSGYRKPEIQKYIFDFWVRTLGQGALDGVAKPGKSEHQLGTTIDLTDASVGYKGVSQRFDRGKGWQWLKDNAYKYGFSLSYPKGKKQVTGFMYEPWHWRFIGEQEATSLYKQGIAFNESSTLRPKPFPRDNVAGLSLSAVSVLSVFVDVDGKEHLLVYKNKNDRLPMASITKLMTALVASDLYKLDDVLTVSEDALKGKGISGRYKSGERFFFRDLYYPLLIGSHNEIANVLAGEVGVNTFVRLMNKKADSLGLLDTSYINPSGLDPDKKTDAINYSTASDVAKLLRYIFENRSDIFSVFASEEYSLYDTENNFITRAQNTNQLIGRTSIGVLGGKTGETPRAKQNLAVVSVAPSKGRIISVVLGSQDNFKDMQNLLEYVKNSFVW